MFIYVIWYLSFDFKYGGVFKKLLAQHTKNTILYSYEAQVWVRGTNTGTRYGKT